MINPNQAARSLPNPEAGMSPEQAAEIDTAFQAEVERMPDPQPVDWDKVAERVAHKRAEKEKMFGLEEKQRGPFIRIRFGEPKI
jgi:hypothetical protein